jgi:hypothetical protein
MANREQLYKYLGNSCSHCGKSVEEMVARYGTFNRMFEFHHVDMDQKHSQYSKLMQRTISAEQIEEVDKCLLLCRDCHGIIHAQNIEGSIEIRSSIGGRVVPQELVGWFIIDDVDKTIKFISNERNLLQPCLVKLGTATAEEFFVLELMQEGRIVEWLKALDVHKKIEIMSASDSRLLLEIVHEDNIRANVRMALGFPILGMDFDVSEGDSSYLWLRNGMVLTKEGELYSEGEIRFPVNLTV